MNKKEYSYIKDDFLEELNKLIRDYADIVNIVENTDGGFTISFNKGITFDEDVKDLGFFRNLAGKILLSHETGNAYLLPINPKLILQDRQGFWFTRNARLIVSQPGDTRFDTCIERFHIILGKDENDFDNEYYVYDSKEEYLNDVG